MMLVVLFGFYLVAELPIVTRISCRHSASAKGPTKSDKPATICRWIQVCKGHKVNQKVAGDVHFHLDNL